MYQTPEDRRKQKQQLIGGLVLALAVMLVIVLGGVYAWVSLGQKKLDELGCPTGPGEIPQLVAVLIDATEPYSKIQRKFIEITFRDLLRDAPTHTWFGLYVIDEVWEGPAPADPQRCKPQLPEDADEWTQNEKFLQEDWNQFQGAFVAALDGALAQGEGFQSPIMQVLQSAVLSSFSEGHGVAGSGARRRIVLISDLLQNTAGMNHYGNEPPAFEFFEKTPLFHAVQIPMDGVEIELLYANRKAWQSVQGLAHLEFWNAYFQAQGAGPVSVKVIPGN